MKTIVPILLLLLAMILFACNKKPVFPPEGGGNGNGGGSETFAFRLSFSNLPANTDPTRSWFAVFSVLNAQQDTVLARKTIPLQFSGSFRTDTIILPKGDYKLATLLIASDQQQIVFAAPIAGSAKAGQVTKPLSISLPLTSPGIETIGVDVLPVLPADQPAQFGYPASAWTVSSPANDPQNSLSIKLQTIIRIGDVVYDSIPSLLTLTTWTAGGERSLQFISLAAGVNDVTLPATAARYSIKVSRWGVEDEMLLNRSDIQAGTLYTIGGSRAAKKLKSEVKGITENGVYKGISKTDYEYDANGKLKRMLHYLKREDNTPYLAFTEVLIYNAIGKVASRRKYNEAHQLVSDLACSYDQQGKLVAMRQDESGAVTNADIGYYAVPGTVGLANYNMYIQYRYSHHYYTMDYNMQVRRGNPLQDMATTSHQNMESGMYTHDANINPYAHLGIPDLLMRYTATHNLVSQTKEYSNAYPITHPLQFAYTYDAEGYPKEQVATYYTYRTNTESHRIKTIYTY